MSVAWRWENVPRRESWPASRTEVPSSSRVPKANASPSAQSTWPERNILSRAWNWRASLGCT